jgi:hypothetical protein
MYFKARPVSSWPTKQVVVRMAVRTTRPATGFTKIEVDYCKSSFFSIDENRVVLRTNASFGLGLGGEAESPFESLGYA